MTPLVAHDNDSWLKAVLPGLLTNTDFLYGTGVTGNTSGAQFWVESSSGAPSAVSNNPNDFMRGRPIIKRHGVSMQVDALNRAQAVPLLPVFQGAPPLYRQHTDKNYRATVIDGGATVYFQYNHCFEDPAQSSADFLAQLNQMLAQPTVQRLVVDLRNNSGGSASILDSWIMSLQSSRFNQHGRLYGHHRKSDLLRRHGGDQPLPRQSLGDLCGRTHRGQASLPPPAWRLPSTLLRHLGQFLGRYGESQRSRLHADARHPGASPSRTI
jgi:hypothetical protein